MQTFFFLRRKDDAVPLLQKQVKIKIGLKILQMRSP